LLENSKLDTSHKESLRKYYSKTRQKVSSGKMQWISTLTKNWNIQQKGLFISNQDELMCLTFNSCRISMYRRYWKHLANSKRL